jgi:hypothetical protein
MELVESLKLAIRDSGKTHYALGKEAKIAPDVLDRFMRGERDVRLATAAKVASVLSLELTPTKPAKKRGRSSK